MSNEELISGVWQDWTSRDRNRRDRIRLAGMARRGGEMQSKVRISKAGSDDRDEE